ncbi:hypothetical protein R3W88_033335 [Solanum pinnatisectum]|uniref:Uncharacterized protein n=1 Tax=Solanum pinnatisectum TaxID=50273 RepID=A0AAV9K1S6_9SOLN|nr:hypothetical protein R3W88_033335 [Solanum pinnatisectum]
MAGAIPSTLHQCLKFEWDHEEVIVYGEKGHLVYAIEERGHLDGEMYHTVELVGNIELQPWFRQKIIDMMAWFGFELGKGFMGGIIDELLDDMKGLSLIKEDGKGCNVVTNEEEKGNPRESDEAKISINIWTSTPSRPRRGSG